MTASLTEFPTIETERLRITPLLRDDAGALQAITDTEITTLIHFLPQPFLLEHAHALIAGKGDGRDCYLGVWDRASDRLLGTIGTHLSGAAGIEIGYWFAADARGRGFAGEALAPVLRALATSHPSRQIFAECRAENHPSWKLLERVGFAPTGAAGDRPGRMVLSWRGIKAIPSTTSP